MAYANSAFYLKDGKEFLLRRGYQILYMVHRPDMGHLTVSLFLKISLGILVPFMSLTSKESFKVELLLFITVKWMIVFFGWPRLGPLRSFTVCVYCFCFQLYFSLLGFCQYPFLIFLNKHSWPLLFLTSVSFFTPSYLPSILYPLPTQLEKKASASLWLYKQTLWEEDHWNIVGILTK